MEFRFGLLHEVFLLLGKRGDGFLVCGDCAVKASDIGIEGARCAGVVCEAWRVEGPVLMG